MSRRISVAWLPTRCGSGNRSGSIEPDEMGEAVVVAVVRRGGEQQQVVGVGGQTLRQLVSLRLLRLVPSAGAALRVGAALVRLVDDDQVPSLVPNPLANVVLLGVVERGDDLRGAMPGVDQLVLVNGGENDVKRLAKPAEHFVLPLDRQRGGAEDKHPVDGLAELHLLDASRPAMMVLPAPGSSASRKRSRGWGSIRM